MSLEHLLFYTSYLQLFCSLKDSYLHPGKVEQEDVSEGQTPLCRKSQLSTKALLLVLPRSFPYWQELFTEKILSPAEDFSQIHLGVYLPRSICDFSFGDFFFFPHSRRDLSFQTNRLLIVYTHIFVPKTPRHVRILLTYSLIYSFLTRAQKIPKSRYYKLQSKIQYLNPNYIE